MRVLLIGKGAREHALAWKICSSPALSKLYVAPGNAGTELIAENVDIKETEIDKLVKFAVSKKINLVVVGPESSLSLGIADKMQEKSIAVFGPNMEAAKLESSKIFAKEFMERNNIPSARYLSFDSYEEAEKNLDKFDFPVVLKADGLAGGKGVIIAKDLDEAKIALSSLIKEKKFGDAGNRILIEEFLQGVEASQICLVDGETIVSFETAQDYKREYAGDLGENTGGMGAYSPSVFINPELEKYIKEEILDRFLEGIKKEKIDYKGVVFVGLMIKENKAKVVEFNVRFGDPETQVLMMRLESDLLDLLKKTSEQKLKEAKLKWIDKTSLCVVLASKNYPRKYETGKRIIGLTKMSDVVIFHAGTKSIGNEIYTDGGRVLSICSIGESIVEARKQAYFKAEMIDFEGKTFRDDIGMFGE